MQIEGTILKEREPVTKRREFAVGRTAGRENHFSEECIIYWSVVPSRGLGETGHLYGEATIRGEVDRLLDRATSGWCRVHMQGEEPSAEEENHMHGMENNRQGEGTIFKERGTICRVRGPYAWKGETCGG